MSMPDVSDLVGRLHGDLFAQLAHEVGPHTEKMTLSQPGDHGLRRIERVLTA